MLKISFSILIQGWDEGSAKYSVMAETDESRSKFAENVLKFLVFYGFDGVRNESAKLKRSFLTQMSSYLFSSLSRYTIWT
jgi:Glycosyl hydrolases family 18